MQYSTKLGAVTMFWAIVISVDSLLCTTAVALEDRLAEWDCGHCQKLVELEIGEAAFASQLAVIVAEHDESQRQWHTIQQSVEASIPVARQQINRTGQFALDMWLSLNVAPKTSTVRTASVPTIFPRTIAMQTLNNIQPTQWLVWQNKVSRGWNHLRLPARIEQIVFLVETIYFGAEAFTDSVNWSVQWAAELAAAHSTQDLSSRSAVNPSADPEDEYWAYYADCDHWQVTFEIR